MVSLCFDVAADRTYVQGHETVRFTPDRRTCEVVFRAWPNKPATARAGNRLDLRGVAVSGKPVTPTIAAGGAPDNWPGTLITVPLGTKCAAAGAPVTIDIGFTLTVGADTPERVGYSTGDKTLWLGTAFPLLAWERGHDWATEPAVDLYGEMVTSEAFRLASLEVIAPAGDDVTGTGELTGTATGPRPGTTVHRFAAPSVRDVAVSVGDFVVESRKISATTAGSGSAKTDKPEVRVHVVAPKAGTRMAASAWADDVVAAVSKLSAHFGRFPYPDLWVTIAPDVPTGVEFPGAIQFGDVDARRFKSLVPHEVAHQWFYGLVGNDQARDPWLDEAFAEYAESLVSGDWEERMTFRAPPPVRNKVGESMGWYASLEQPALYSAGVYRQGGAMLHQARMAIGAKAFDAAVRSYVSANAHQIATPADVAEAFKAHPKALSILRRYGAVP